jgi:DNA-binding winged helix-turn-helix (wHTH) protein
VNELVRHPVYAFEGFRLDAQRRLLFGPNRKPIVLTPRLFDALLYFVEHGDQLLTKEQLLEAIWPNVIVEEHNLNKTVSELRRLLGEKPGEHRFIVTKPGHGYRFVADVSMVPSASAAEPIAHADRAVDPLVHEPGAAVPAVLDATPPATPKSSRLRATAWWGAGAIAAAAVLVAFLPSPPEQPLRITPWSVKKGTQWFPAWSPDSGSTAFVTFGDVSDELPELVIRDVNEPIARRLARRPANDPGGVTQWTTTGRILHLDGEGLWSSSPVGGPSELLVPLDYERLGLGNLWLRMLDVSRDGSALAAFGRDGDESVTIWTATPPGAMPTRYEPAPFAGATFFGGPFLRFSPSGRQLLLAFYAAGRGLEAWLMPFPPDARKPPHRVFENVPIVGDSVDFSWLADDRHVVLAAAIGAAEADLRRQLYVADTQSGAYRSLAASFNGPALPVVAPDGRKLLVMDGRRDFDVVTLDLGTLTLARTIATDRSEILPAWAAHANAMVYASDRSGAWEIWLRQEPQPDRPLVTARDFQTRTLILFAPTLSPDGERVVFHRVAEGDDSRLWIAAVAGGRPEPLTTEELTERAGSWSPDGEWYVYWASASEGGARTLKKVRTTGRATPETLLEDLQLAGNNPAPIWSPDGRWVLVPHEGLTLYSLDGGASRRLGTEAMPCAFADNEPLLHCIRGSLGALPLGDYALVELDFDGNIRRTRSIPPAYRPVAAPGPGIRLSPTPDRLGVTYSVEEVSMTLWLVEGLDHVRLP